MQQDTLQLINGVDLHTAVSGTNKGCKSTQLYLLGRIRSTYSLKNKRYEKIFFPDCILNIFLPTPQFVGVPPKNHRPRAMRFL